MGLAGIFEIIKRVPDYEEFFTVDELDKELELLVNPSSLFTVGVSKEGRKIRGAQIGHGKKKVLIFGFPHPNEPFGSLVSLILLKHLRRNEELRKKYTWYIIPCADPDGATLNEGWFKGEFTLHKFVESYYRSKDALQTDWTFPVAYRGYEFNRVPENVRGIMRLITRKKPDIIYPMHNSVFSGAYFFISKQLHERYYDDVIALCGRLRIPMHMGEPELPLMKELKRPIYLDFCFEDLYEYYMRLGEDPKKVLVHGTTSIDFGRVKNPTSFGMIGEVPFFYDRNIADTSPTNKNRRHYLEKSLLEQKRLIEFITKTLKINGINEQDEFYDLLDSYVAVEGRAIESELMNLELEKYTKRANVAEKFSCVVVKKLYNALMVGQLRRLLLRSEKTRTVKKHIKMCEIKVTRLINFIEKNSELHIIPIKKCVQLQLGFLLITLHHLEQMDNR